jgi:hypothetical protein
VLVTQLVEGQRATVLQLPVSQPVSEPKPQIIADRQPASPVRSWRLPIG